MTEDDLPQAVIEEASRLIAGIAREKASKRLEESYRELYSQTGSGAYDWQKAFHDAGLDHNERALIAANRVGKTECLTAELACHALGWYPKWWQGRKWNRPVSMWVGSETNEASRDIIQSALFGPQDDIGTGWLPFKALHPNGPTPKPGLPNVMDSVRVRHLSGGWSSIGFKTYKQGRSVWQGTSKDIVAFDEEPPADVYYEGLTRVLDSHGMVLCSFTPLIGATEIVGKFWPQPQQKGQFMMNVTWDDAPHLAAEEREALLASYPPYMRKARTLGIPMLGSGAVYPILRQDISYDPFPIPDYFRRICGIDFGIDHPAAAVWLAHDPDADILYVYDCYKASQETIPYHAAAILARGDWIPVAWPHDGMKRDYGSGSALAEQYRKAGVTGMLYQSARIDEDSGGSQPIWPTTQEILVRMQTGRFKVAAHLEDWFKEQESYHVKDGKIVAVSDDLMCATRYAVMDLRYARVRTDPYATRQREFENYSVIT